MRSQTFDEVARALDDPRPETRRLAVLSLPTLGPEAGGLLLRALGDEDWRVRKEAAEVAARVEPRPPLLRLLVSQLRERANIGLRNTVVLALVAIGSDAFEPVRDVFGELDPDARKLALEVLGGIGDVRASLVVAGALRDEDVNVRTAAAEALGRMVSLGARDRSQAADALVLQLPAEEPTFRIALLQSLAALGARVPWATLAGFVGDSLARPHLLELAARVPEPGAIEFLVGACGDLQERLAREAVVHLAHAIEAAEETQWESFKRAIAQASGLEERLRRWAVDGDEDQLRARRASLMVLGLVGDPHVAHLLALALADERVAEAAERALGLFGDDAVEPLVDAARQLPPPARGALISLVPQVATGAHEGMVDDLRDGLQASTPDVVSATLRVIATMGGARDLDRAAAFVQHGDPRISSAAAGALRTLGARYEAEAERVLTGIDPSGPRALVGCVLIEAMATRKSALLADRGAFLRAALSHADARVRRAAIGALALAEEKSAASAVRLCMLDEDRDVALSAVRALGRFGSIDALDELVRESHDPGFVSAALSALFDVDPALAERSANARLAGDCSVSVRQAMSDALVTGGGRGQGPASS